MPQGTASRKALVMKKIHILADGIAVDMVDCFTCPSELLLKETGGGRADDDAFRRDIRLISSSYRRNQSRPMYGAGEQYDRFTSRTAPRLLLAFSEVF